MFDKKAWNKEYYQKNKEKRKIYVKNWQIDNREYLYEYRKKYRKENSERIKEYNRQYDIKYRKEYFKEYGIKNRERLKKYQYEYFQTEEGKATNQRRKTKRRATERKMINTLTAQEWADILEAYNYRCAYCDVEFNCELLPTKDHVIPISNGGNNTKENVVPACKSCNSKKGYKLDYKPVMAVI